MNPIPPIIHRRDTYIERLRPFMRTPIVKVLVGGRRVGKSYILFQLMELITADEPDANILYINKEDIAFVDITDYKTLHEYIAPRLKDDSRNYIFIDEIQEIVDFKLAIRSLALNERNDIYITGSNSKIFSSDIANALGGRYIEQRVYSLSYPEFLEFHQLPDDDASLEQYIHFGGLPYLIHLPMNEPVVMEYLQSIYSTIVLRDVIQRKNIRNTSFLDQLLRFISNNIGSLFSAKSISDFLKSQNVKISPALVIEYADALTDAFIIDKVGRYDIAGKRFFERGEKFYFENLGIRNVISGYKWDDRGKRMENLVYNHLLYCGYKVSIGNLGTAEIDFVGTRGNETIYIQVAAELSSPQTISREFGNLLMIKDNYPKIVVSGEKSFENTYSGIQHLYIRDFLTSTLTPQML